MNRAHTIARRLAAAAAIAFAVRAVPAQTPAPDTAAARASLPAPPAPLAPLSETPPPLDREFRGVWVASVANIDWPSRPGLSTAAQKAELLVILDRAVAVGLNAVIFQVRPASDALYASSLEPWSEYLTGTMGRAPSPYYDPLAFAIAEAHRRGLELHAWFNPYRARDDNARSPAAASHVSRRHPELVRRYGGFLWLDPGDPRVRAYSTKVVLDVVRRYDVDGVHIDDYFYPYRIAGPGGRDLPFPDDVTYRRYRRGGGRLERDDWRRHNVDVFVRDLYAAIKREKRWVKFGVSPFGIWRPGNPPQIAGLDAYSELYADSRLWMNSGWLDYLAPQLYWPVAQTAQSFPVLLQWWAEQNRHDRHLWPGLYTGRVGGAGDRGWRPPEILEQIRLTRLQGAATGDIHFSMKSFLEPRLGLDTLIATGPYSSPAIVPASPWLGGAEPAAPTVTLRESAGTAVVAVRRVRGAAASVWAVRARYATGWRTIVLAGSATSVALPRGADGERPDRELVAGVGRTGLVGPSVRAREAVIAPRSAAR